MVLTYGIFLSLLNVIVAKVSSVSLALLGTALVLRFASAWLIGVHWLQDSIVKRYFWLVPINDIVTLLVWILSFAGRKVEWRGVLFELDENGKLVQRREDA